MAETCPTRDELAAFAVGDLARDRFEGIAVHAEQCPRCARTLSELDELPNPLVDGLRASRGRADLDDAGETSLGSGLAGRRQWDWRIESAASGKPAWQV